MGCLVKTVRTIRLSASLSSHRYLLSSSSWLAVDIDPTAESSFCPALRARACLLALLLILRRYDVNTKLRMLPQIIPANK